MLFRIVQLARNRGQRCRYITAVTSPPLLVGLNHAVLWTSDAGASAAFYRNVLGLEVAFTNRTGVFLRVPGSTNDHDLGIFTAPESERARSQRVGLYHLAWEVPTLRALVTVRENLMHVAALVGESDHGVTKSLYAHDPDGIEFEVMWQVPLDLLTDDVEVVTQPLDIAAEIDRYGADTPSRSLSPASEPERSRT